MVNSDIYTQKLTRTRLNEQINNEKSTYLFEITLVGKAGVWSIWAPFATRRLHSKEETN